MVPTLDVKIDFSREHKALAAREEEFRGKHVIVVGDAIYPFEDGEDGLRILERVGREHPNKIPLVTYVMKEKGLYPLRCLRERKHALMAERFEMLSRYRVNSPEELKGKIEIGEVPEHPTWEDYIELTNLEDDLARLAEITRQA